MVRLISQRGFLVLGVRTIGGCFPEIRGHRREEVNLFCCGTSSFRLAVLETARGRKRASSYGFKASLWLKRHYVQEKVMLSTCLVKSDL